MVLFEKNIRSGNRTKLDLYEIHLPVAGKQDLDLYQVVQELVISIKNEVRRFPLPKQLAAMEIEKAKLEGEHLRIYFKKEE